jgi:hypothetical protein
MLSITGNITFRSTSKNRVIFYLSRNNFTWDAGDLLACSGLAHHSIAIYSRCVLVMLSPSNIMLIHFEGPYLQDDI